MLRLHRSTHTFFSILVLVISCVGPVDSQTDKANLFDLSFERFSFMEFDLNDDDSNFKDVMFCEGWCEDQIITVVDTLYTKFNLDLSTSFYYIHLNDKVISIKSDFIKSFSIGEKNYINYKKPGAEEVMILELLVDGAYQLFRHHAIVYKKPDFNPLLDIGSKKGSYKRKFQNYAFCDERLIRLPSKTKKLIKLLQKECKISVSKKNNVDIVNMFRHMNSSEK